MARGKMLGPVPVVENSPPPSHNVGGIEASKLLSIVERIERLEEEKRTIADDIKEIKKEAKATGFETKVISYLIRERRKDQDDINEFETLVDLYKRALAEGKAPPPVDDL